MVQSILCTFLVQIYFLIVDPFPFRVSQVTFPSCLIRPFGTKPHLAFAYKEGVPFSIRGFLLVFYASLRILSVPSVHYELVLGYDMTSNRSHFRNVNFYDGSNPSIHLGGLVQNGSVTEAIFLEMLGIVLVAEASIRVQNRSSGYILSISDSRLEVGSYDVYCDGTYISSFIVLDSVVNVGKRR